MPLLNITHHSTAQQSNAQYSAKEQSSVLHTAAQHSVAKKMNGLRGSSQARKECGSCTVGQKDHEGCRKILTICSSAELRFKVGFFLNACSLQHLAPEQIPTRSVLLQNRSCTLCEQSTPPKQQAKNQHGTSCPHDWLLLTEYIQRTEDSTSFS